MLLLREGYVTKIQEHLLHSLNSHPSNWPSAVQSHALSLLRSGDVATFPALVRRVLEDVRQETTSALNGSSSSSDSANGSNSSSGGDAVNGGSANGSKSGSVNGTGAGGSSGSDGNLAIPQAVVDAVLKVVRECLESVCEVDDGSTAG